MAAPAGIPEVVAASADDIHPAQSDAIAAAAADIVEAEGYGLEADALSRAGRPAAPAAAQGTDQMVATTTADPQHSDAHAPPQPLSEPSNASAEADDTSHAEDTADNPYLVHDAAADDGSGAIHDDTGAEAVHDDTSDGQAATE